MPDILKTWPSAMPRRRVIEAFTHDWGEFFFTLGRGCPKTLVNRLYYTHQGQIIGYFQINRLVRNDGTNIPPLRSITGELSAWQIKPDAWVAVCRPPFERLKEKIYHEGFRGWRYFSLEEWSTKIEARVRL